VISIYHQLIGRKESEIGHAQVFSDSLWLNAASMAIRESKAVNVTRAKLLKIFFDAAIYLAMVRLPAINKKYFLTQRYI
jgi:hypothetical protein